MTVTQAQQTLFKLIASNLFGQKFTPDPDTDWAEVYDESRVQAVTLLAFQNFKDLPLDKELSCQVEEALYKHTVKNILNFRGHAHLHKLMTEAGIPYCVLKGIASAHYYPSPLIRTMGDVDFYIAPADAERTMHVLETDGFVSDSHEQDHHVVYRKPGMHFELHREVAGVPDGNVGQIVRDYLSDLTKSALSEVTEFVTCNHPTPFQHGLIMLLHMQHHLLSEGIGLRHLCDWAVFVNSFDANEFAALFESGLKNAGLWIFTQAVSLAASRWLGLTKHRWMGDDNELADALIADILEGGNFGRKKAGRNYEGMFISDRGKDGVGKSRVRQGIESMNRIVRSFWPVAAKLPIIYPFGWIYFTLRYFFRVLIGKHKAVSVVEIFENSGKRKELYSRLKLYETDKE